MKKMLFPLLSFFISIISFIVICEFFLRFLPVSSPLMQLPVNENNTVKRFKENRDFIYSKGWNFSIVGKKHSNNYGFLQNQDYNREATTPLMAIIGDSFVEARHVDNIKAMHGILSQTIGSAGRVYNFSSSGSPLSSYLAYAKYANDLFSPASMVFIIIGNDFHESLLKYNNTQGETYFIHKTNGEFSLKRVDYEPTLTKKIARSSALIRYLFINLELNWKNIEQWFHRSNQKEAKYIGYTNHKTTLEVIRDSKEVTDEFLKLIPLYSQLNTSNILFVIDGIRPQLYSDSELSDAEKSYFGIMRKYFIESARKQGYETIDMQPIFINKHKKDGSTFEFPIDGHWNPPGHALVAKEIASSNVFKKTFRKWSDQKK